MNRERLSEGQAGFLVPPGDPNELTHAMVTALFKSELRDPRLKHARDTQGFGLITELRDFSQSMRI